MPLDSKLQAMCDIGHYLQQANYHFVSVTPQTHHYYQQRHGDRLAADLRDVFGWCLPFEQDLFDAQLWELMQRADIIETRGSAMYSKVRWASLGDTLFVHSAYPTDAQDAVFFGPDTYRFVRAMDAHLRASHDDIRNVVDIGCGSGAGATYLATQLPEAAITAVDINPRALEYTEVNLRVAKATNVTATHSNLLDAVDGQFDLIVANPPYMEDPEGRAYRHGGTHKGAELSLSIVDTALERLAPGGTLLLYTGVAMVNGKDMFLEELQRLVQHAHCRWQYQEMDPDVFGEELLKDDYKDVERIAAVELTLRKLG